MSTRLARDACTYCRDELNFHVGIKRPIVISARWPNLEASGNAASGGASGRASSGVYDNSRADLPWASISLTAFLSKETKVSAPSQLPS